MVWAYGVWVALQSVRLSDSGGPYDSRVGDVDAACVGVGIGPVKKANGWSQLLDLILVSHAGV